MGKENIFFLSVWIILGNIFATFSSDPEPTTTATTVFGKSDLSACLPSVKEHFHESPEL